VQHLLSKTEAGLWNVNKKSYGDFKNLQQLVNGLSKPGVPGWPTPLSEPVLKKGGPSRSGSSTKGGPSRSGSSAKARPKWLYPESTTREDTEKMLRGNPDGSFVVRKRPEQASQYVLSVNFRGKPVTL
jgi:hypothetical protein